MFLKTLSRLIPLRFSIGRLRTLYLWGLGVCLRVGLFLWLPLGLIYAPFGAEFSNLWPIATMVWTVMFFIFVQTPSFLMGLCVHAGRWLGRVLGPLRK